MGWCGFAELNVFTNLRGSLPFVGVLVSTIALQILIVSFGGEFVKTVALSVGVHFVCMGIGAWSLVVGTLWLPLSLPPPAQMSLHLLFSLCVIRCADPAGWLVGLFAGGSLTSPPPCLDPVSLCVGFVIRLIPTPKLPSPAPPPPPAHLSMLDEEESDSDSEGEGEQPDPDMRVVSNFHQ